MALSEAHSVGRAVLGGGSEWCAWAPRAVNGDVRVGKWGPVVIEGTDAAVEQLDPALLRELGVEPARATLLQFSSAFCAPCRAVRRVSAEVAGMVAGVRHVEVDAESHLEAVRALGIERTSSRR